MQTSFKIGFLVLSMLVLKGTAVFASVPPTITLTPNTVIQGEPVMATLSNVKISDIKNASFDKKPLSFFLYQGTPTALIGIDLNKKAGEYEVTFSLKDNSVVKETLTVNAREKKEAVLAVPEKLGGNSPSNQKKVVTQLAIENQALARAFTSKKSLWSEKFKYPISNPIVTDPYGYSRLTGVYTITHKGTDFHADLSTNIFAMNRGVVRVTSNYSIYGKTIVIDHGLGLFTFYMHLSKIYVNEGELVKPGQLIGLSGKTGYAEMPHLHLSVRINKISIDPIKFLELFK